MARLTLSGINLSAGGLADRRPVLRDLDMAFDGGEMIAITGPSGCGKTSLLSILSLIVPPDAGTLRYDGVCLSTLSGSGREDFRRRHCAMIFQTLRLIEVFTMREHIALRARASANPDAVLQAGLELLSQAGLGARLDALPRALSGGEKQRAALSIALSTNPAIVLADEPSAALDETNSRFVAAALRRHATGGAIVVVATHDPILCEATHGTRVLQKL